MVIRSLTPKDLPALKKLLHYCFYDTDLWSWESPLWEQNWKLLDLKKCFGYFIDNQLVSSYLIREHEFYVRGITMKMGGVAGVATRPEFRRRGFIRDLTKKALNCMQENGLSISVLYPFKFSFYRQFGYEHCSNIPSVISKPSNIRLPADFKPLPIKELSPEKAFKVVQIVRARFGGKFNLILFSSEDAWRFYYLRPTSRVFGMYFRGEPVGYFITELKKLAPWEIRLIVSDQLMGTEQAWLTLLYYLKNHAEQVKDFKLFLSGDEEPLDYFIELWGEGEDILYQISGGAMFRVVDVKKALQQLPFQKNLMLDFTLKINDELAVWNTKPLRIQIKGGSLTVQELTQLPKEIDVQMDIKAFTQLFVGYHGVEDLLRLQKITINEQLVTPLSQAFPKQLTRLKTEF